MNKQKLELTWIGKHDEENLEPRILLENSELSYGDNSTGNIIIHADNLLALKSLEENYSSRIKCIYIDPPFNTGVAFEHYDDGIEHSLWLSLMNKRFKHLYTLLANDGILAVHLDDNEMAYCKVILDEVFGRHNYLNTIALKTLDPSGFKSTGTRIFNTANYILIYAKNRPEVRVNPVYIQKKYDKQYNQYILNRDEPHTEWLWKSIKEFIVIDMLGYKSIRDAKKDIGEEKLNKKIELFAIENADSVFRKAVINGGAYNKRLTTIDDSKNNRGTVYVHPNEDLKDFFILDGDQILFYKKRLVEINGDLVPGELITNFWNDISWNGIAKEGAVQFKNGKKPEALVKRILELFTQEGDLVLDSFLGSATTIAVAHKMKRRYIGIELGKHAVTHCVPRMKSIIKGEQSGISKILKWQGGGGFKFYTLAPSLLRKDKFDNWIIEPSYNADLLASALAKQEAFTYHPDSELFWKQGYSTENDFIFTTTQFITVELIDRIHDEMGEDESLLVCAKTFQDACLSRYENITLKKIPKVLLGKCEFAKDDYSLNITETEEVEADDE
jgi:adenine-specific DNA-methyltransferase